MGNSAPGTPCQCISMSATTRCMRAVDATGCSCFVLARVDFIAFATQPMSRPGSVMQTLCGLLKAMAKLPPMVPSEQPEAPDHPSLHGLSQRHVAGQDHSQECPVRTR